MGALMRGVVNHWTAGTYKANKTDKSSYHFVIEGDGDIVPGVDIRKNIRIANGNDRSTYAAHTSRLNTGHIGNSMASMANAKENGDFGKYPFTEVQFKSLCLLNARQTLEFNIDVTDETVLTHAEVQPNLGIVQNNKWDITVIPWDDSIKGAKACGDFMRSLINRYRKKLEGKIIDTVGYKTLNISNFHATQQHRSDIKAVRSILTELEYLKPRKDKFNLFDDDLVKVIKKFQDDTELVNDGIVGPNTWWKLQACYNDSMMSSIHL